MGNCTKCGSTLGEYSSGELCPGCQSTQRGSGTPDDVPCQRCGMYLPSHELQMWNARLYCAYCIMDVKDEEKMHQKYAGKDERARQEAGSSGSSHGGDAPGAGHGGAAADSLGISGVCERCGKETDPLYSLAGRRVCGACYDEEGKPPPFSSTSFFGQLVIRAKEAVGIRQAQTEPKIITLQRMRHRVFDVKSRKMVEREEEGKSPERGKRNSEGNGR